MNREQARATMDGAAPDTRLKAQRKAYTAARSVAANVRGAAAFEDGRRVGAIGVSGLPGEDDERLARAAIERAGLTAP